MGPQHSSCFWTFAYIHVSKSVLPEKLIDRLCIVHFSRKQVGPIDIFGNRKHKHETHLVVVISSGVWQLLSRSREARGWGWTARSTKTGYFCDGSTRQNWQLRVKRLEPFRAQQWTYPLQILCEVDWDNAIFTLSCFLCVSISEKDNLKGYRLIWIKSDTVMWSETIGLVGQDWFETKKSVSVLILQVWCCYVKHDLVTLVVIMCLEHHYCRDQQWRSLT